MLEGLNITICGLCACPISLPIAPELVHPLSLDLLGNLPVSVYVHIVHISTAPRVELVVVGGSVLAHSPLTLTVSIYIRNLRMSTLIGCILVVFLVYD